MLTGLKKRQSYDELINEIGKDPIKKYPDRRASQIENSSYMSQLASGFQEVAEQQDRLMKEKTKELLLQDIAATSSSSSHHSFKTVSSQASPRPFFIPRPPVQFEIGTPRVIRPQIVGPDFEPDIVRRALEIQMEIDDDERIRQERRQEAVAQTRNILRQTYTAVNTMVPEQPDDDMNINPFEGVFSGVQRVPSAFALKMMEDKKKEVKKEEKKEEIKEEKKEEIKEEKKKRGRPPAKKLSKLNDEPDDQPETTIGRASSRAQRVSSQAPSIRSRSQRANRRSKSVEITAEIPNSKEPIEFWAAQSPNELRAIKIKKETFKRICTHEAT